MRVNEVIADTTRRVLKDWWVFVLCLRFKCPAFSELYRETVDEVVKANAAAADFELSRPWRVETGD